MTNPFGNLPSKVYFVAVLPGGKSLDYRQKGGGHFTQEKAAVERYESLIRTGVRAAVYSVCVEGQWDLYLDTEGQYA